MSEESVILKAEVKMGDEAQSSASPWATQLLILLFFAPIVGVPIAIGAAIRSLAPGIDAGPGEEWSFLLILIGVAVYFVWSLKTAKESQWLGLSYYGSREWTDSLRIAGEFIDYGELKSTEEGKPVQGFRFGRPLPVPKAAPGSHLWGIRFDRKTMPEIDIALPEGEHPEKCMKFVGHLGYGYVGWLPWMVKHISYATFLRTSWTQDPNGRVVPIGILTDYDLMRERLRQNLEPKVPTREEMKVASNVRDHYYRDEAVKELEIERVKTENLKKQLKDKEHELGERLGAMLDQWDKGGKKKIPGTGFAPSRRQKIVYLLIVASLIGAGAWLLFKH